MYNGAAAKARSSASAAHRDAATRLFYTLLQMHPFGDGNGRTCKLLWEYTLGGRGETIHDQEAFLRVLREAQCSNDTLCSSTSLVLARLWDGAPMAALLAILEE